MARKKPHIHYIYKTTCNVTKRYYIGMHSTTNLEDGYLGSGKRLRYSIRKYGKENHTKEILEFLPTREELVIRESEIVDKILISDKMCMNLKPGGQGGFCSDEHKLKLLNSSKKTQIHLLLKTNKELSEKHRESSRKRMIELHKSGKMKHRDWTGKKHKESSKKLIGEKNSKNQKGKKNSQYGTCWITNGLENKKIYKDDLIPKGWRLGRIIKKNITYN